MHDAPALSHDRPGRIAVVLGTRPEAIKLHGIVDELGPDAFVISTGQHFSASMGSAVHDDLGFPPPEVTLEVGGARRGHQVGAATAALDALFAEEVPAAVVVQGDTNATLAGALAACAAEVPLVHVEAGLRSFDRAMPEEHNRVVVDHLADLCCAPTDTASRHLEAEAIAPERIAVTGNTVVEAVTRMVPPPEERQQVLAALGLRSDGFVLATLHRPENTDDRDALASALGALGGLGWPVLLPLHPRTAACIGRFGLDALLEPLTVCPPQPPSAFLGLAADAALWVSDSGGLQEEASVLKKPVLVLRRSTERPEVEGTFAELCPRGEGLGAAAAAWLEDPERRRRLRDVESPYGDGSASARIVALTRSLIGR